ncbi:MAG TPA: hypothetical protein VLW50_05395 [Streptosporangiaceae bacterium]|nr:hypothetical protein [Streptosporangiaceae bacterium]
MVKRIAAALAATTMASGALLGGAISVSAATTSTRTPPWCEFCGLTGTSSGARSYTLQPGTSTSFQVSYWNTGAISENIRLYTTGSYASVSPASNYLRAPRLGPAKINATVTIAVPEGAPAGTVADSVTARVPGLFGIPGQGGPSVTFRFKVNVTAVPVAPVPPVVGVPVAPVPPPTVTCTSNGESSYNMQAEGNAGARFVISCTQAGGTSGTAAFRVSGSYATVSPASISVPGSATVTIAVPSTAPSGTVTDTVNATATTGSDSVSAGTFSFDINVTAAPAPTLTVTPSSLTLAAGGSPGSVSWTDTNGGLTLSGPASGWLTAGPPASCPDFSCAGSYSVNVPSGTQPGKYDIIFTNAGLNGTYISKTLTITVTAPGAVYGVRITSPRSSPNIQQGVTASFPLTVQNSGNTAEIIGLSTTGAYVGVSPPSVSVPAGGSATFTETVAVPQSAEPGAHLAEIYANVTNVNNGPSYGIVFPYTVTASGSAIGQALEILGASVGSSAVPPYTTASAAPVTITNTGKVPETFRLSTSSNSSLISAIESPSGTVQPGDSATGFIILAWPTVAPGSISIPITSTATGSGGGSSVVLTEPLSINAA